MNTDWNEVTDSNGVRGETWFSFDPIVDTTTAPKVALDVAMLSRG